VSARSSIPEGRAFSLAWRRLDRDARRRVRRAVNRAQPAEHPSEAALAVAMARGQQRFWRYGWVFGPILAVVLLVREPLPAIIANAVFATVVFGVLAVFLTRPAPPAAQVERDAAPAQRKRPGGK
jgi:hypothetical protein